MWIVQFINALTDCCTQWSFCLSTRNVCQKIHGFVFIETSLVCWKETFWRWIDFGDCQCFFNWQGFQWDQLAVEHITNREISHFSRGVGEFFEINQFHFGFCRNITVVVNWQTTHFSFCWLHQILFLWKQMQFGEKMCIKTNLLAKGHGKYSPQTFWSVNWSWQTNKT